MSSDDTIKIGGARFRRLKLGEATEPGDVWASDDTLESIGGVVTDKEAGMMVKSYHSWAPYLRAVRPRERVTSRDLLDFLANDCAGLCLDDFHDRAAMASLIRQWIEENEDD